MKSKTQIVDHYRHWKERRRVRPGLTRGLLASYWDDLVEATAEQGYTWYGVRRTIEIAKPFARYAESKGVRDVSQLTDELVAEFFEHSGLREAPSCLGRLMAFLRGRGVVPCSRANQEGEQAPPVVVEFLEFLRDHRNLSSKRRERHRIHVQAFVDVVAAGSTQVDLDAFDAEAIGRFVTSRARSLCRSEKKVMCAAIRAFLRFLRLGGYGQQDLVSCVPVIPMFKLDRVPHALAQEDIEAILAAVDQTTPQGSRDYAILVLLATYGMRPSQLVALRLDDFNWRHETIRIPAAKGDRAPLLPLLPAAGEAVVSYLRRGRPGFPFREVFLRVRPPIRPLSGSIRSIIKPYAIKAGVSAPTVSPRAWRHACASRLLAARQPLKTIRDVLGHRCIETTFIYTKVDVEALRQAALEWPGMAS
jgi:integrase/recombinase XerD